ncbi:MAG TPA: hypothetical protein VFS67_13610 [Polyangiaceae bacterium]|nr:hypothetical protein [Polyangiaceae bacterium]
MITVCRDLLSSSPRRSRPALCVALAALTLAFACGTDEEGRRSGPAEAPPAPPASTTTLPNLPSAPAPAAPAAPNPPATGGSDTGMDPGSDPGAGAEEGGPGGDIDLAGPAAGSGDTPAAGGGDPVTQPADPNPPILDPNAPPPDAFVEDRGENCEVGTLPTFADLQELRTLPDPFTGLNGQRLTSRSQWRCRREEIRKLAETFIYGVKPGKPEQVNGTVSRTSITVNIQNQGQAASFTANINIPANAPSPAPAVIIFSTGGFGSSMSDSILAEGVATITFDTDSLGTEANKQGAFYTANPNLRDTGTLLAWSWGVSRMIDVIEASGAQIINPRAIGVHGCSRLGKGAFIAGAFDERVALTIPYESGMSGVPAFRFVAPENGEVLRNAYEYGRWAGETYRQFLVLDATDQNDTAGRARDQQLSGELQYLLPLDTHEVIGMVAPRGLLVLGNPGIANLVPRGENITVQAGREIYSALGAAENISYTSTTTNTTHCSFRQEYVPLLQQNLRKFLKGDASATTGAMQPNPSLAANLADNIAWQTPTLSE